MSVYSYTANNKKKWRAVYRYTDFTGKRRQTQKRGFDTKRDAEAWLSNKKRAENGQLNMTFGSFYEIYERDKKARVKETTFETKSYLVRDKILPYFKDRTMDEIKPKDVITKMQTENHTHQVILKPFMHSLAQFLTLQRSSTDYRRIQQL